MFDETVTRHTSQTNQSLEETRNNIALLYLHEPIGRCIELKENGKFIGIISIYWIWIFVWRRGDVGVLNKDCWKPRSCDEATKAVIALAFEQLGDEQAHCCPWSGQPSFWTGDGQIRDEIFSRGALRDARDLVRKKENVAREFIMSSRRKNTGRKWVRYWQKTYSMI